MDSWRNARMTYGTEGYSEVCEDLCDVNIDETEIVVSYKDEHGHVIYRGADHGNGHFALKCPERHGSATLHRLPNRSQLEGFWTEEGYTGWWRIELG